MTTTTVADYLVKLASDAPVPGGGAATAITAAQGAALLAMVARISGMPAAAIDSLDKGRLKLEEFAKEDGAAFARVMAAMQLPKTDTKRASALETALQQATEVPLAAMDVMGTLLDSTADIVKAGKASVISDAGIAAELLYAAMTASRFTVRINLKYIKTTAFQATVEARLEAIMDGRKEQKKALVKAVKARI
jgi:formiminotetrahydrofolate cyclodeaminase